MGGEGGTPITRQGREVRLPDKEPQGGSSGCGRKREANSKLWNAVRYMESFSDRSLEVGLLRFGKISEAVRHLLGRRQPVKVSFQLQIVHMSEGTLHSEVATWEGGSCRVAPFGLSLAGQFHKKAWALVARITRPTSKAGWHASKRCREPR